MKSKITEPELSRPLRIEKVSANGVEEQVVATPREREALARRFDLREIKSLTATLAVRPKQTGLHFAVDGNVKAEIVQGCVVTLEPLQVAIEHPIHVHFAAAEFVAGSVEHILGEDDMEPITDGIIDLGELVAQHLGLALDPYPRKPGLPPLKAEYGKPHETPNPFAKLVTLKKEDGNRKSEDGNG